MEACQLEDEHARWSNVRELEEQASRSLRLHRLQLLHRIDAMVGLFKQADAAGLQALHFVHSCTVQFGIYTSFWQAIKRRASQQGSPTLAHRTRERASQSVSSQMSRLHERRADAVRDLLRAIDGLSGLLDAIRELTHELINLASASHDAQLHAMVQTVQRYLAEARQSMQSRYDHIHHIIRELRLCPGWLDADGVAPDNDVAARLRAVEFEALRHWDPDDQMQASQHDSAPEQLVAAHAGQADEPGVDDLTALLSACSGDHPRLREISPSVTKAIARQFRMIGTTQAIGLSGAAFLTAISHALPAKVLVAQRLLSQGRDRYSAMATLTDLFRETLAGQFTRWASGERLFKFPEELEGFVVPECYKPGYVAPPKPVEKSETANSTTSSDATHTDPQGKANGEKPAHSPDEKSLHPSPSNAAETASMRRLESNVQGENPKFSDLSKMTTQQRRAAEAMQKYTLVDWYDDHDQANPMNWSTGRKIWVGWCISILTFAVYTGSSIITLGFPDLIARTGVSSQMATLALSMYVLAYGVGALFWSPLSEIAAFGRNPWYGPPMLAYLLLQVGATQVNNFNGLIAIRFFTGFLGAPTLATGGASLTDVFAPQFLPLAFSVWALAAFGGPSIGPAVAGFAAARNGWHWTMYELLWLVGFALVFVVFGLPETSHGNILLRRAERLRKLTGNDKLRSAAEIEKEAMTVRDTLIEAIVRPTEIFIKDPAVMFADVFIALIYAVYYLFFEALPLWQDETLHWRIGIQGISYLCILVGGVVGALSYIIYQGTRVKKYYETKGIPPLEMALEAALPATILSSGGLWIFAWTARGGVNFMGALTGLALFAGANFVIFQCIILYISMTYPRYAASLLAFNDFLRSSTAAGLLHAGRPFFVNVGLSPGVSILAGITLAFLVPCYFIYKFGDRLRARSKFVG
ncbi:uncharacterized protein L969DRAFT_105954 [Mixia osmundae IAM 14324]|uniref:Major facilitator superfamily (MFS) profile domain-containing protein n=1 Tax=Mixia osmundae (strain CBS 9802 / IAM 14324 / JCM 22182 / KY 12970) TaxID=764103 RepID=G7EB48_MIXOS|nr:uncharacterized protein L969DRAFT_105954 [Mixia osmundae IAM 14324]KEI36573.1 hypothetical protein L969DRAFT_105954 [Mixia osmundae IAM 14324]GAB00059.1 hypothetical protein E5Q_06761 [Mixia osmundae IAM 14324]